MRQRVTRLSSSIIVNGYDRCYRQRNALGRGEKAVQWPHHVRRSASGRRKVRAHHRSSFSVAAESRNLMGQHGVLDSVGRDQSHYLRMVP
jgi:hypothetical protein